MITFTTLTYRLLFVLFLFENPLNITQSTCGDDGCYKKNEKNLVHVEALVLLLDDVGRITEKEVLQKRFF